MCLWRYFREDIFEKCIFCKKENNGTKHVINEYVELKELWDKLINELNKLDIKNWEIKYFRKNCIFLLFKWLFRKKEKKKNDNKGIQLIKTFIKDMYFKFGEANNKKDQ